MPEVQTTTIDASKVQKALASIVATLVHQIRRAWPQNRSDEATAAAALMTSLQIAFRYWEAEGFVVYTSMNPTEAWRDEHSLILPLVDRALLETACNVIFMIEDLQPRARWFNLAGWKDARLEIERLRRSSDPSNRPMQEYIQQRSHYVDMGKGLFGITEEEANQFEKIQNWLPVTQMKKWGLKDNDEVPSSRLLIRYLVDDFYKELSGIAHGEGYSHFMQGGLAAGMLATQDQRIELRDNSFPSLRSTSFLRASAFLLCIASEIQMNLGYTEDLIEARIFHAWDLLSINPELKQIFDIRYRDCYPFVLLL